MGEVPKLEGISQGMLYRMGAVLVDRYFRFCYGDCLQSLWLVRLMFPSRFSYPRGLTIWFSPLFFFAQSFQNAF